MVAEGTPSGFTDGTKKQNELSRSRNPMGGNSLNADNDFADAQNYQKDKQNKIASQEEVKQENRLPQKSAALQPNAPATGLKTNLQTMNSRLAAKINQIMGGGRADQLGIDSDNVKPTYNSDTGKWESASLGDIKYDFDPLAQEKMNQIGEFNQEISPYFKQTKVGESTNLQAQDFDKVLSQFADTNNDGVIDPQEQAYLEEAQSVANLLKQLDQLNPRSAEAQAIKLQLQLMDKSGLTSDIKDAYENFNAMTGKYGKGSEIVGDIGDEEYDFETIINMKTDDLKDELMKSLTGQSSFFSGDFESALTQNRLKSDFIRSNKQETTVNNALKETSDLWAVELENTFTQFNDEISSNFKQAYENKILPAMVKKIAEKKEGGEATEALEKAMQWFDDLYKGEGKDNIGVAMEQLLSSESGLALSERRMIADVLGSAAGISKQQSRNAIVGDVMSSISKKGYAEFKHVDEFGTEMNVVMELTSEDKMFIYNTMGNESLSEGRKQGLIGNRINARLDEATKNYADPSVIKKYIEEGRLEQGLDTFMNVVVESMSTYSGSIQQQIHDEITDGSIFSAPVPEGEDPKDYIDYNKVEQIKGEVGNQMQNLLKSFTENSSSIQNKITSTQNSLKNDSARILKIQNAVNLADEEGYKTVVNEMTKAAVDPAQYQTVYKSVLLTLKQYGFPAENLTPQDAKAIDGTIKTYLQYSWLRDNASKDENIKRFYEQNKIDPDAYLRKMFNFSFDDQDKVNSVRISGIGGVWHDDLLKNLIKNYARKVYDASDYKNTTIKLYRDTLAQDSELITNTAANVASFVTDFVNVMNSTKDSVDSLKSVSPEDIAAMALRQAKESEANNSQPDKVAFHNFMTGSFDKDSLLNVVGDGRVKLNYSGIVSDGNIAANNYVAPIATVGSILTNVQKSIAEAFANIRRTERDSDWQDAGEDSYKAKDREMEKNVAAGNEGNYREGDQRQPGDEQDNSDWGDYGDQDYGGDYGGGESDR